VNPLRGRDTTASFADMPVACSKEFELTVIPCTYHPVFRVTIDNQLSSIVTGRIWLMCVCQYSNPSFVSSGGGTTFNDITTLHPGESVSWDFANAWSTDAWAYGPVNGIIYNCGELAYVGWARIYVPGLSANWAAYPYSSARFLPSTNNVILGSIVSEHPWGSYTGYDMQWSGLIER
jgi:hypothetical protein